MSDATGIPPPASEPKRRTWLAVTWPVSSKQRLALWCRRINGHRRPSLASQGLCIIVAKVGGRIPGVRTRTTRRHSPCPSRCRVNELEDESYARSVRPAHHAILWPHEQDFSSDTIIWDILHAASVGLDRMVGTAELLSTFDVGKIGTEALLFQTGYLTITGEEELGGMALYRLGYPNREVRQSLNGVLLSQLVQDTAQQTAKTTG